MVMSDKLMRDGISLEEMERKLKEMPMPSLEHHSGNVVSLISNYTNV